MHSFNGHIPINIRKLAGIQRLETPFIQYKPLATEQTKYLLVVGGPTAVGKTAFSIRLAQDLNTEIISADSRQLYRQMNIGTAKPTAEELAAVPHHFIDILDPDTEYSAGQFERDALLMLNELFRHHQTIVVAGGSGLYVQALVRGMDQIPELPAAYREQLNSEYSAHGLALLLEELQERDPQYWQEVDRQNPVRIIRALEVCRATGSPYSSYRQQRFPQRPFQTIKIGLERPRQELYTRIDQRMEAMVQEGLFEEAEKLYPYRQLNALQTVGYQEIFAYLDGAYDREEAIRLLKRNSRHYAKRQITWFKKDPEFHWYHPDQYAQAYRFICAQLEA
jgi:tRNA dimethylallyltransferase